MIVFFRQALFYTQIIVLYNYRYKKIKSFGYLSIIEFYWKHLCLFCGLKVLASSAENVVLIASWVDRMIIK